MQTQRTSRITSGFTLLEVMVALVIFSVGLLGLAGLQANGMRANKTADLRTMAVIQAHDFAERLRANQSGVEDGEYDDIDPGIPTAPANCYTASCDTATAIAQWDIFEWQSQLADALPMGMGNVERASSDQPFEITVMYDERRTSPDVSGCGDVDCFCAELKCYRMDFLP